MKTKTGRLFIMLMLLCIPMVLGLCGCSNKKDSNKEDNGAAITKAPTQAAEADTAPAEDEDVAPAADQDSQIVRSDAKLTVSKESGVYEDAFDLEISCDTEATIYYTTDGSDPTTSETRILYEGPIKIADRSNDENYIAAVDPFLFDAANVRVNGTQDGFVSTLDSRPAKEDVDKCTVIRAVGVDKSGAYTEVATNTYFIGSIVDHVKGIAESCEAAGTSLAIISLSINYDDLFDPVKGIYVKGNLYDQALKDYLASGEKLTNDTSRRIAANYNQKGRDWERNVHVDFFESDGTTTTLALSQDAGIRIQGNYSRSDLQKGFRLFARKSYGKKAFEYPIFGESLKNDAGETITSFKTLTLRNGGNCAFSAKYNDTYWQKLIGDLKCDTQTSRPCVVYIDGEYFGLYVLQEDYSEEYFEAAHGVNKDDVVLYKGDAEVYASGYKLDLGALPAGETDESYYFQELKDFFRTHADLKSDEDYQEFCKLVDPESARDYFAVQIWINNKWDWPGKNWSLWKTINVEEGNPYADGRWRFVFYDMEFGGFMGRGDINVNTLTDDNYTRTGTGMFKEDNTNIIVTIFQYLMSNKGFREDFKASLLGLGEKHFERDAALAALDKLHSIYEPLYDQFFARYKGAGSKMSAIGSYQNIKDFLGGRADAIQPMIDYIDRQFKDE